MAAWPLVRADLDLSYLQVGVLLSAPHVIGTLVEPALGILGDAWDRRALRRREVLRWLALLEIADVLLDVLHAYLALYFVDVLVVYPAFLLVAGFTPKLALLGALGVLNAGWYAILKARPYAELAGQSATVLTLGNVFGLAGSLLPLGMGIAAERLGLGVAMWLLLLSPLALLVGLPRRPGAE